jgi:hypothetical protein
MQQARAYGSGFVVPQSSISDGKGVRSPIELDAPVSDGVSPDETGVVAFFDELCGDDRNGVEGPQACAWKADRTCIFAAAQRSLRMPAQVFVVVCRNLELGLC